MSDAAERPRQLVLRHAGDEDVAPLVALEGVAFASGWAPTAFARELKQNRMARYIVLEERGVEGGQLVSFAGAWLMVDEAHVVAVAVLPECRRQAYGRLLVHGLVDLARREGMQAATLECRISNSAARALYRRYGFFEVGLRKHYYADNGEDAVIMTTEELESPAYVERLARLERELEERLPGVSPTVVDGSGTGRTSREGLP